VSWEKTSSWSCATTRSWVGYAPIRQHRAGDHEPCRERARRDAGLCKVTIETRTRSIDDDGPGRALCCRDRHRHRMTRRRSGSSNPSSHQRIGNGTGLGLSTVFESFSRATGQLASSKVGNGPRSASVCPCRTATDSQVSRPKRSRYADRGQSCWWRMRTRFARGSRHSAEARLPRPSSCGLQGSAGVLPGPRGAHRLAGHRRGDAADERPELARRLLDVRPR